MTRPDYRLIDHTADMAFVVEATGWRELLEVATAAVSDVILQVGEEDLDVVREVEVAGADREDVLVAWLNEVVIRLEEEAFLARRALFEHADATGARGRLLGRILDGNKEPPDRVIKAVTYHDLHVVEGDDKTPWRAQIVLDL